LYKFAPRQKYLTATAKKREVTLVWFNKDILYLCLVISNDYRRIGTQESV